MSNDTTLTTLIDRALDYADMAGSSFPVRARLVDYVNDGLSEIHETLAGEEYFRSVKAYTLTAGTEAYALPGDFYKTLRVWRVSSGRRRAVEKFTLAQLDGRSTTGPSSADTIDLWYVPQLKRLRADNDKVSIALPNGWETFVALHAAIQLLSRGDQDVALLAQERERVKQRIVSHCEPRDHGTADVIEDVHGRWGGAVLGDDARALRYRVMGNEILFVEFDEIGA